MDVYISTLYIDLHDLDLTQLLVPFFILKVLRLDSMILRWQDECFTTVTFLITDTFIIKRLNLSFDITLPLKFLY